MTLEVKKPCYFCGGIYEKVIMEEGYEVSTAVITVVPITVATIIEAKTKANCKFDIFVSFTLSA
jgi:hypothetical protein